MSGSSELGQLTVALAKAQAGFPTIVKKRTAEIKTDKGTYTYHYADLADMLSQVTPILSTHGLVLIQCFEIHEGDLSLVTRLLHTSGEWLSSSLPLIWSGGRVQEFGSQITYFRRYSVAAMLGIAAEDDTDAQEVDRPKQSDSSKPRTITLKQRERLYAKCGAAGKRLNVRAERVDDWAKRQIQNLGYQSSLELTKQPYEHLCEAVDALRLTDLVPVPLAVTAPSDDGGSF